MNYASVSESHFARASSFNLKLLKNRGRYYGVDCTGINQKLQLSLKRPFLRVPKFGFDPDVSQFQALRECMDGDLKDMVQRILARVLLRALLTLAFHTQKSNGSRQKNDLLLDGEPEPRAFRFPCMYAA